MFQDMFQVKYWLINSHVHVSAFEYPQVIIQKGVEDSPINDLWS